MTGHTVQYDLRKSGSWTTLYFNKTFQGLIVVGGTNDGGKMSSRAQLVALSPYADPGCPALPGTNCIK